MPITNAASPLQPVQPVSTEPLLPAGSNPVALTEGRTVAQGTPAQPPQNVRQEGPQGANRALRNEDPQRNDSGSVLANLETDARALRTGLTAAGVRPTPQQANQLLNQVTLAQQNLNRLSKLDQSTLSPAVRELTNNLTELVSANTRVLRDLNVAALMTGARALRTGLAAGGVPPTPQQANQLLNQVTVARQNINRLFTEGAGLGGADQVRQALGETRDGDLANLTSKLDLRISPADRALAMELTDLVSANLRVLNQAVETTPRSQGAGVAGGYQGGTQVRLFSQGDSSHTLDTAVNKFHAHVTSLIPHGLLASDGNRNPRGPEAAKEINQLVWGFKDMLRNDPDVGMLIGSGVDLVARPPDQPKTFLDKISEAFRRLTGRTDAGPVPAQVSNPREAFLNGFVAQLALGPGERATVRDLLEDALNASLPSAETVKIGAKITAGGGGILFAATFNGAEVVAKQTFATVLGDDGAELDAIQETALQGRLQADPNIPKVIGIFERHGDRFIVMEKVPGPPQSTFFDSDLGGGHSLPPNERMQVALHLFGGVTRALETMHGHDMVHLDLKPANTMIDRNTLEARLIDFGSARPPSDQPTKVIGTAAYMAPEITRAEDQVAAVHTGSDIWSMGVSLVQNLGIPLFQNVIDRVVTEGGDVNVELINAISQGALPFELDDPTWLAQPPGVRDLILHCLHPEPNGRPTAAQMVQAMNGEMVTAAPPGGMGLKAAQVVALNVLNPASGQLAAGREILARPGILPS